MYRAFGKRLCDLLLATLALVVLAPVFVLVAILVRLNLGAPVLFRQRRPGLHGRPFTIFKFRTMTDERDAAGELLPDAQRLTPFGRFLRSTSLDELPELFNVLCGQMSLVGPRPLTLKYMPYFSESERRRFDLRPGITGWAQINGRNNLGWDDRLACDVWYAENCSPLLDLKILCITVVKVLRRADIQVDPKSHMPNLDEERSHRLLLHG
jgi:lipopolysaccharide/colanic/teichoic acid biosynthesis glycosyltransferase